MTQSCMPWRRGGGVLKTETMTLCLMSRNVQATFSMSCSSICPAGVSQTCQNWSRPRPPSIKIRSECEAAKKVTSASPGSGELVSICTGWMHSRLNLAAYTAMTSMDIHRLSCLCVSSTRTRPPFSLMRRGTASAERKVMWKIDVPFSKRGHKPPIIRTAGRWWSEGSVPPHHQTEILFCASQVANNCRSTLCWHMQVTAGIASEAASGAPTGKARPDSWQSTRRRSSRLPVVTARESTLGIRWKGIELMRAQITWRPSWYRTDSVMFLCHSFKMSSAIGLAMLMSL
mmetsp:Transcript_122795/g.352684  ORF Transcript_122795/g.352684 Transcript_122795/m.352684 type:complete len:287 (+) Transcript_122795:712-1572(+)